MDDAQATVIRCLLADWVDAEMFMASETSSNLSTATVQIVDDAADTAAKLGIHWDVGWLSGHVQDQYRWAKDEGY